MGGELPLCAAGENPLTVYIPITHSGFPDLATHRGGSPRSRDPRGSSNDGTPLPPQAVQVRGEPVLYGDDYESPGLAV